MIKQEKTIIDTFYQAFAQRDYRTMATCYHPYATFKDPVFELEGKQIHAMWHMLCQRGKDLRIEYSDVEFSENVASANWTALYTFSKTKNKVVNHISASFVLKDGLIVNHVDDFIFYNWASQALGITGVFLGWTSFLKNKVRTEASDSLNAFISVHPEYQD